MTNQQTPHSVLSGVRDLSPPQTLARTIATWTTALGFAATWGFVPPASARVTFPDIQGHWAQGCIEDLAEAGIVRGYPNGRFAPDRQLTRAEFAALIRQAYPVAPATGIDRPFFDVPNQYWGYEPIREAQQTEFLAGYPDGVFRPEEPLLRVQALVALSNGLGYTAEDLSVEDLPQIYTDFNAIPNYALGAIAAATENRLVVNYPNPQVLNPLRAATRAEVAGFLCQARAGDSGTSSIPVEYIADIPDGRGTFTESQRVGGELVLAQLSYQKQNFTYRDLRLTVVRGGVPVLEETLPNQQESRNLGFQLKDLDGDGDPELIVDFFVNPPRCCSYSVIYRFAPWQGRYVGAQYAWDYRSPNLQDLDRDGIPEFDGFNTQFPFEFVSSYDDAAFPKQVLQYRQGELFDVTRQYPEVVRENADRLWQDYLRRQAQNREVKGVLAAYLVDKHALGEGEDGWRQVRQSYTGSDRERFLSRLQGALRRLGYSR
ncbi:MAG TPA: S-layer homology domain-containing protein [Oscillatoriales cyanobacterium M4454_W2019_049]|nr:S-layer homology domain-containing protein [Oscillatoriales cyanobacterium M4454_W2019_049]